MKKNSVLLIALVIALCIVFIVRRNNVTATNQETESRLQPQKNAEQPSAPEIRSEPELVNSIKTRGLTLETYVDSEGYYTMGDVTIEKGQRFLEMRLLKRDIDGQLSDLPVRVIVMEGDNNFDASSGLREPSSALRMAIGGKGPASRVLHRGDKYKILSFIVAGESSGKKPPPSEATFKIPENLPPHSVYNVELVLIDEQYNEKLRQEKEQYAQRVKNESIIVNLVRPLPEYMGGAAMYQVKSYKQKPVNTVKEYSFRNGSRAVLPGPNKLGGELLVGGLLTGPSGQRFICAYAYIRDLQKRNVNIPEDADIIFNKKDMIPVTISLDISDIPEGHHLGRLNFFEKVESKLFLLAVGDGLKEAQKKGENYKCEFLIPPGKYFLKLKGYYGTNPWLDYLHLGTIEITPEQKHYKVKIPEYTDWKKLYRQG